MEQSGFQNPVIFVFDKNAWAAHSIFNPNEWSGESKAIIASCSAQFKLLLFASSALSNASESAEQICKKRMAELQYYYQSAKWNLHKARYFVEVPQVHLSIQAFLVTAKTLLDLLAQLISTEGFVRNKLHGFHKKPRKVVGGEVLYSLEHKQNPALVGAAMAVRDYISAQKQIWINQAVLARDNLAHAERGMTQVMWELEVRAENGSIRCDRIVPPHINGFPFDHYIKTTTDQMTTFMTTFLQKIRRL